MLRGLLRCLTVVLALGGGGALLAQAADGAAATPAQVAPADSATDTGSPAGSTVSGAVTRGEVEAALAKQPAPTKDAPATRDYQTLQDALKSLDDEASWRKKLAALKAQVEGAGDLDQALNAAKNRAADLEAKSLPYDIDALEAERSQVEPELRSLTQQVSQFDDLSASAPQRRVEQSQRRNDLRNQLSALEQNAPAGSGVNAMAAGARRQAVQAEVDYLDEAIGTADTRKTQRGQQREIADTQRAALAAYLARIDTELKKRRAESLAEQESEMRAAVRMAAKESPVLKSLAEANLDLLERRKEIGQLLMRTQQRLDGYRARSELINERLDEIQQRVEITGFSQAAAAIMLKELHRLPKVSDLQNEQQQLESEVRQTQLELFDLETDFKENADPLDRLEAAGLTLDQQEQDWVKANADDYTLRNLLTQNVALNRGLRDDASRYFEALLATDSEIVATLSATDAFREYASENILWIPSRSILSVRDVTALPGTADSAINEMLSLLGRIINGPALRLLSCLVFVLGVGWLVWRWGNGARYRDDRVSVRLDYGVTLRLLLFDLTLAILPLAALRGIAWALLDPQLDVSFGQALSSASVRISLATFTLVFLLRLTRPGGLAERQFHWLPTINHRIWQAVARFLLPAVAFTFVALVLDAYGQIIEKPTGARVFLVPAFLCCIAAFHWVFAPRRGVLALLPKPAPLVWRWTVYIVMVGWQVFLAGLVIGGYMLGSVMLWGHTFRTVWLVVGVLVLKDLIERYLEIQQLRAREQEQAEGVALPEDKVAEAPAGFQIDDSTRQVLTFLQWVLLILGASGIWSDSLPSFRKLGEYPLIALSGDSVLSVSQCAMLLVCVVTTVLLARSLPRLVEILVLRRMRSIDPGSRHAFSTLVAYVVIVVGIVWASNILLIQWGQIQWLVAAISVGLGFGLQEIFGNLVAGIILLFERPIRVGDIVTVGATTGKVTRIQMRGTTIMEWDRRELIVPNKEFVTGQLTNWTLSDTLTRLSIKVGVAYGSDIGQVKRLLLDTIGENPNVLRDPAPAAYFIEFGESSLDFVCHAYLGTLDARLSTSSDLQQAIYDAFNAAGISIPFPQRDLHIIGPEVKTG